MCLAPFSLRARTPELPSDMGIDTGDARRRSKCAPGCQVAILIGLGDAARSVVNASLRRAKGRARERRIRERLGPESQSIYGGGRALARLGRHRQRWHCRGTHRRRALASRCAGPRQRRRKIHSPDEAMKRCISWCVSPPLECPLLASRAPGTRYAVPPAHYNKKSKKI
jgi:hypothetical protein